MKTNAFKRQSPVSGLTGHGEAAGDSERSFFGVEGNAGKCKRGGAMTSIKLFKLVCWLAAGVVALVPGSMTCEAALNGATVATAAGAAVHQVATQEMELVGEEGAEIYCREQGYKPLLKHTEKQYRHGWDQVWFDEQAREIVCIEAKGGAGRLRPGQETIEHAIDSARRILYSPRATARERKAAQLVLEYAEQGRLRVEVVHTSRAGGARKVLRQVGATRHQRRLAQQVLDTLQREDKLPLPRGTYGRPYRQMRREVTGSLKRASQTGRGGWQFQRYLDRAADAAEDARDVARGAAAAVNRGVRGGSRSTEGIVAGEEVLEAVKGLRRAGRVTEVARGAGKALGVAAAAAEVAVYGVEAYQIEQQYRRRAISPSERVRAHVRLGARTAGGAAGGAAGAWAGASAGAAIGSAAGPVGTVVGGVVGGVAGAIGGSEIGSRLGEAVTELPSKVRRWWSGPSLPPRRPPKRRSWLKRAWGWLTGD